MQRNIAGKQVALVNSPAPTAPADALMITRLDGPRASLAG
jgi:hypothetical protein